MAGQRVETDLHLLVGGQADQAHDPGVRPALKKQQPSEVLIQGYERPALSIGKRQYLVVTRVFGPVSRPDNIVTSGDQRVAHATPHRSPEAASCCGFDDEGFHPFLADDLAGIEQAGLNVL